MARSPVKYQRFLEELPKHNNVITRAALAAGFSKSSANTQQKRILKSAMKYKAEQIVESLKSNQPVTTTELKKTMAELVGMSKEELMNRVKYLATQDKDLGVALRVVTPLVREQGVDLSQNAEQNVNVPILNVVVKEKNVAQPSHVIDVPTSSQEQLD